MPSQLSDKEKEFLIAKHDTRIGNHETRIDTNEGKISAHETMINGHDTKIGNHETRIDNHEEEIIDHEKKIRRHDFYTLVFLCLVQLFNIFAITFIIASPWSGQAEAPWFYTLPLLALLFLNVGCTVIGAISCKIEFHNYFYYNIWQYALEGILLLFNVLTTFLFAFHPLAKVTGAVIALIIFLALSNIMVIAERITCWTGKVSYKVRFGKRLKMHHVINALRTVFLLVVLIIFIFWIRV